MAEQEVGVVVCVCVFFFFSGGGEAFFTPHTLWELCILLCFWQTEVTLFITCHAIPHPAPKIWETVPPGLKGLPYQKFKKEWKSYLLTNQIWPCLYVVSLILSEILFLSLLLPIISTWRCPTRKLLLLWTLYTNELNVF